MFDLSEYERRKADKYNASAGALNLIDGYDCPKCRNRGNYMEIREINDCYTEINIECECMGMRRSLKRLELSGLKSAASTYKFENYKAVEEWQRDILRKAHEFIAQDEGAWFFIGGAIGSGKTHICTAIAMELMKRYSVKYALWPDECARLKAEQFGSEDELQSRMWKLKSVPLLYQIGRAPV